MISPLISFFSLRGFDWEIWGITCNIGALFAKVDRQRDQECLFFQESGPIDSNTACPELMIDRTCTGHGKVAVKHLSVSLNLWMEPIEHKDLGTPSFPVTPPKYKKRVPGVDLKPEQFSSWQAADRILHSKGCFLYTFHCTCDSKKC